MKNISIVQAIIFTVMGLAIITAVFIFAFNRGGGGQTSYSEVVIWGYLPQEEFSTLFDKDDKVYGHIIYVEKPEENFENELVSALAEGRGPDLVILRENQIIENKDRLIQIPYDTYDLKTFRETFIEEGNLLALDQGFAGLPFSINPLVMYYNRDTLNSNGIAIPPTSWTELLSVTPNITQVSSTFDVYKTSVALGTFNNIKNAKEIVWSLIMQAGNNVIQKKPFEEDNPDSFTSILNSNLNYSIAPAVSAVNFYTQFANPNKTIYSWNRSLPSSQDFFLAGNSAFYLGFASELPTLSLKNPNLIFDVAELPQAKDSTKKTTYGKMYSIAMTRGVKDVNSAFSTMLILTNKETQSYYSQLTGLPSVRRDLLTMSNSNNSFDPIFKKSALFSYGILEPKSDSSSDIIKTMIQSIISGELEISTAVDRANAQLNRDLEN